MLPLMARTSCVERGWQDVCGFSFSGSVTERVELIKVGIDAPLRGKLAPRRVRLYFITHPMN